MPVTLKIHTEKDPVTWKAFTELISQVEQEFKYEKKTSRGKLKQTIPEIKSRTAFCSYPIVSLPGAGTGIFLGDIHGDSLAILSVLKQERFLERIEKGEPLFLVLLGDYANRGKQNIKTLEVILLLKKTFPKNIFLIRGNHEEFSMGQHFGLFGSCIEHFGFEHGQDVFQKLNELFDKLPSLAVAQNGLVAVHGGVPVSPQKGLKDLKDEELLEEIRWNDPTEEIASFIFNYQRGNHYLFGREVFDTFLRTIGGTVLLRSHEYVALGAKTMFGKKLLNIFSNGGTSSESGYRDFILTPKYVRVDLSKPLTEWKKEHVLDILY